MKKTPKVEQEVNSSSVKMEIKEEPLDLGMSLSKRASSSAGRAKVTPKKKAKQEDNVVGSPGDQGEDVLVVTDRFIECSGCFRNNEEDSSYTMPGAKIEFQRITVGALNWCDSCSTVWRNRVQFTKEVVALVTLRYDNVARVNAAVLQQRVEMLEFVFTMTGVPFPFFRVMAVEDMSESALKNAINFVEIRCRNRDFKLGALLPLEDANVPTGATCLRCSPLEGQRLRPKLCTNSAADMDLWQKVFSAGCKEEIKQENMEEDPSKKSLEEQDDSFAGSKYRIIVDVTNTIISDFKDDNFRNGLKEQVLNKELTKLLKHQHEIMNAPEVAKYAKKVKAMIDAVASAKKMFGPIQQYFAKYNRAKLREAFVAAEDLRTYFSSQHLSFGPQLSEAFWRAEVGLAAESSLEKVREFMLSDESHLLESQNGDVAKVSDIVSDTVINCGTDIIKAAQEGEESNDPIKLYSDLVGMFTRCLNKMEHADPQDALSHLGNADVIVKAAAGEHIIPARLMEAKDNLQDEGASKFWQGWFETPLGLIIRADADMLLAGSALDDNCVSDHNLAVEVLRQKGMPKKIEGGLTNGSWKLFVCGDLEGLIEDAIKNVEVAVKSWSPIGIKENSAGIVSTIEQISDALAFLDFSLSVLLLRIWGKRHKEWEVIFTGLPLEQPMPLVAKDVAETAADLSKNDAGISECENVIFASEQLVLALAAVKDITPDLKVACDRLVQVRTRFILNHERRVYMWAEMGDKARLVGKAYDQIVWDAPAMLEAHAKERGESLLIVIISVAQRRELIAKLDSFQIEEMCLFEDLPEEGENGQMCFWEENDHGPKNDEFKDFGTTEEFSLAMSEFADSCVLEYFLERLVGRNQIKMIKTLWGFLEDSRKISIKDIDVLQSPRENLELLMTSASIEALASEMQSKIDVANSWGKALEILNVANAATVVVELLQLSKAKDVDLDCAGVAKKPISKDAVLELMPMYAQYQATAAFTCWFLVKCIEAADLTKDVPVRKGDLPALEVNPVVKDGHAFLGTELRNFKNTLLSKAVLVDVSADLNLNVDSMVKWCDTSLSWCSAVSSFLQAQLMVKIEEVTTQCSNMTPRWTHIVSNSTYNAALVKRQLLGSPARNTLPGMSNRLHTLLESSRDLLKSLCADPCDEIVHCCEHGDEIYKASADAIALIAALSIIEEFGNTADGKEQAKKFLAVPAFEGFPKKVETKLVEISRK